MMDKSATRTERIDEVKRIFEDFGFGDLRLLESWDGDDLGELSDFLTEDEFQTLLDELQAGGEDRV